MSTTIEIEAGLDGFVEDKEQARHLREETILPALARQDELVFDFSKVSYATQSYIHGLIGEALQKYGEEALDLIEFRHCAPTVRSVIELVVDYSLGGFPEQQVSRATG